MGHATRVSLFLMLASLTPSALIGQVESRSNPPFTMWLSVAPLSTGRTMGAVALTAQHRWLVLSGRLALWDDPCDASDCWPNGDIGMLAGYGAKAGGRWHVYGAAGLSSGFDDNASFLAIPLQAEVTWRPLKFIGVGVMGFASICTGKADQVMPHAESRSFGGVSLAVQLGKVR